MTLSNVLKLGILHKQDWDNCVNFPASSLCLCRKTKSRLLDIFFSGGGGHFIFWQPPGNCTITISDVHSFLSPSSLSLFFSKVSWEGELRHEKMYAKLAYHLFNFWDIWCSKADSFGGLLIGEEREKFGPGFCDQINFQDICKTTEGCQD